MKKAIYWFRYDLRLADNPGWAQLVASCGSVVGVFVLPKRWFVPGRYQSKGIESYRLRFLLESLADLRSQLRACGSELIVLDGDPAHELSSLAEKLDVGIVGVGLHPGSDECDDVVRLQNRLDIPVKSSENFTLFDRAELPFDLQDLPDIFSQFRKRVEHQPLSRALPAPQRLRHSVMVDDSVCVLDKWCAILSAQRMAYPAHSQALAFSGGTKAGVEQLQYYLEGSHNIASYKETRNQLDGWDFSSKLSPWLALGCISARQVAEAIHQYEHEYQANDSTYWLYFELIWREYFQWLAFRYGKKMFALRGIQHKNPLLSFYSAEFTAWCYGNTASDFVNAFMRQLLHTGWMSNRGRQIVASYLINELGIDWRYGAAWFEQQLIDYDVAANWGNWQYLAGVGTDPRGRRHFNIEKQRQTYDPESIFIERWIADI
ncbi:DASH family cryptochrome [Cellvibrio sp.]